MAQIYSVQHGQERVNSSATNNDQKRCSNEYVTIRILLIQSKIVTALFCECKNNDTITISTKNPATVKQQQQQKNIYKVDGITDSEVQ